MKDPMLNWQNDPRLVTAGADVQAARQALAEANDRYNRLVVQLKGQASRAAFEESQQHQQDMLALHRAAGQADHQAAEQQQTARAAHDAITPGLAIMNARAAVRQKLIDAGINPDLGRPAA